jgi:hypothetical protein
MQHSLESPIPSWSELESSATHAVQQLNALELSFSNEQPPPDLFEHLVIVRGNEALNNHHN